MIAGINRINHDAVTIEYSRYSNHMVNYEMKASRASSISNLSWFRQMDDMLLRKVEELTLYVIELNEKLEVRSSKLEALEKENEEQDKKLMKLEEENAMLKGAATHGQ